MAGDKKPFNEWYPDIGNTKNKLYIYTKYLFYRLNIIDQESYGSRYVFGTSTLARISNTISKNYDEKNSV